LSMPQIGSIKIEIENDVNPYWFSSLYFQKFKQKNRDF
jgi:hypothetical protein